MSTHSSVRTFFFLFFVTLFIIPLFSSLLLVESFSQSSSYRGRSSQFTSNSHRNTNNNNKRILSRFDDPAFTDNNIINIDLSTTTGDEPIANSIGQPANIPPCISDPSQVVYINGVISATSTFFACMNNMADPGMLPTFFNGSYTGITQINTTLVMNNLEYIDEIEGTARLQFSLRLYWQDNRYAMPALWDDMNPNTYSQGIDLTQSVLNNGNTFLWLPTMRFPDASEVNIISQYLKLNASNIFFLSYALDITLVQPGFNFKSYPDDSQDIVIRYVSYNFNKQYVEMGFYDGNALIFNEYINGENTFDSNQIWTYESAKYYTTVGNGNSYAVYEFNVSRQGSGIIVRLVLPIAFLLLLSTLTFWVLYENRVDTTITLLLSVSALYIVILGNIPLVGYLTNVDRFVFWMFLLLVAVVSMHQIYATLKQKVDRWPLRAVVLRIIEFTGRVIILPFIVVYFLTMITYHDELMTSQAMIGLTSAVTFIIAIQEVFGVKKCIIGSVDALIEKVNNPETTVKDLSLAEFVVLNWMQFKTISTSKLLVAKELQEKGSLSRFSAAALQIKHLASASDLLVSSTTAATSASDVLSQHHQRVGNMAKEAGNTGSSSPVSSGKNATGAVELKPFQRVGSSNVTAKRNIKNEPTSDPFDPKTINPLSSSVLTHDSDDEA